MTDLFSKEMRLNAAALLLGASVASLYMGRAVIGIFLGLALILTLVSVNHREVVHALRPYLDKRLMGGVGIVALALAVNIPFSLRIGLSAEAWARTFVVAGLIFYILFCLRHHLQIAICSLVTSIFIVMLAALFLSKGLPKALVNGFVLIIPACLYLIATRHGYIWKILGIANIGLCVTHIMLMSSKVSLLGLLLVALSGVLILFVDRQNRLRRLFLFIAVVAIGVGIAVVWLPEQTVFSSRENSETALIPVWMVDLHRQLIWKFSFDLFQYSPWVGLGLNASNYHPMAEMSLLDYMAQKGTPLVNFLDVQALPSHPHNWIVEIILDGGIIGAIPFVMMVCWVFIKSLRVYLTTSSFAMLGGIAVNAVYWGTGLFNFSYWSMWWQVSYFVTSGLFLMLFIVERERMRADQ
ncbi:hypothetical protein GCM10011332_27040 [Terasakiella brassicae]|uniref:O-antigen ligase-related domain-containing protein n=1 Tax=Terasakiella brassicae TaxID=1634917 RepID=A0A917FFT2_9PROT|nr:O-antigen ligase family protein [Terasakiella brassicae]GGF71672.1 hypothetical protein GCM10011332_27040 [Terasakiella brassicae]